MLYFRTTLLVVSIFLALGTNNSNFLKPLSAKQFFRILIDDNRSLGRNLFRPGMP